VEEIVNIDKGSFGHWLSGFVDAEGCFSCYVSKVGKNKGLITTEFSIQLREDDIEILNKIRDFLGCGAVVSATRAKARSDGMTHARDQVSFKCRRVEDLVNKVIPIFEKYGLRTKKRGDFFLWKEIVRLRHESKKIRKGSPAPLHSFPDCVLIQEKVLGLESRLSTFRKTQDETILKAADVNSDISDEGFGDWLAGFTDGEGCFGIYCYRNRLESLADMLSFYFMIKVCNRDADVINKIKEYLKIGQVRDVNLDNERKAGINCRDEIKYQCRNIDELPCVAKVFSKYCLRSKKAEDFVLWKKALDIQIDCVRLKGHKNSNVYGNSVVASKRAEIRHIAEKLRATRNPGLQRSTRSSITVD
jgi:hypothetical protein